MNYANSGNSAIILRLCRMRRVDESMSRKTARGTQQQQQIRPRDKDNTRINNALRVLTPVCQNALAQGRVEGGGGTTSMPGENLYKYLT